MNRGGSSSFVIERLEEPFSKSKRQSVNKRKKEKKKEMGNQAKIYREQSAKGIQRDDEDEDDVDEGIPPFYRSVLPNVCNICGVGFNSIQGRKNHMKQASRKLHDGKVYDRECDYSSCGCYYANDTDLQIHKDFAHCSRS